MFVSNSYGLRPLLFNMSYQKNDIRGILLWYGSLSNRMVSTQRCYLRFCLHLQMHHYHSVDKDKKEIVMLCEVNGTFTEPTRHGIVYKGGSNGEKAVLRGWLMRWSFIRHYLISGQSR